MIDALAKADSDTVLPRFNADEYNEFNIYLKRI